MHPLIGAGDYGSGVGQPGVREQPATVDGPIAGSSRVGGEYTELREDRELENLISQLWN